ncbi:MAG: six-cysteine ranthipeptide SCIFF [Clostridia bacterium]|nr:six-cysteine ranthipeptide SCIFF [Clostridia bacterium]
MKHIETIQKPCLKDSLVHGGCGECQASCQSACKTSCTVANQSCANKENSAVLGGNEGKLNRNFGRK